MGLTEQEARELIAAYGAVPALVQTSVVAQTAEAEARIRSVRDLVNSIPTSKSVTVNYSQNGVAYSDSREGRANGGAIYGPGGPRDDKAGLFALSNGEHVLDSEDVRRMGGQAAVYRFRQMLDRGNIPGLADGGQVAVPASTWRIARGSAPAAPMATASTTIDNSRTVTPTVSLGSGNTFYSYDPSRMAKDISRKQTQALALYDN